MCTLLSHMDEHGVFDLDSYEAAKEETEARREETKEETGAGKEAGTNKLEERDDVVEAAKDKADDSSGPKDSENTDTATGGNHDNS